MEMGLVNFEKEKEIDIERLNEIETAEMEKIAEIIGINTKEMDNYGVMSLRPLTHIFANNFSKDYRKYRIYPIEELQINAKNFFIGDLHKLGEAQTTIGEYQNKIGQFVESINLLEDNWLDGVAKDIIHYTTSSNGTSLSYGMYKEVIALLPKDNILLKRKFCHLTTEESKTLRKSLVQEGLIQSSKI